MRRREFITLAGGRRRRLAGLMRADKLAECERVHAKRTRADVFFRNIRFNWRCIPKERTATLQKAQKEWVAGLQELKERIWGSCLQAARAR
jgi:hypothetical protein